MKKPMSEETKRKISEANKGKKRSEEAIKKMSIAHLGKATWNKGKKGLQVSWLKGTKGVVKRNKTSFEKGLVPWNKGKKASEETIGKLRESHRGIKPSEETIAKRSASMKGKNTWTNGRKLSEETKKKVSDSLKGRKLSEEHKRKVSEFHKGKTWRQGKKHSEGTKKKMSEAQKGDKSHSWQGGISFEPYGLEFNKNLREVIRNRDRRKCQICEKTELEEQEKLSVHHIDYDKKNNNPNNLISLCHSCHMKTNHKREYWVDYFRGLLWQ